jgi:hypothetical protein
MSAIVRLGFESYDELNWFTTISNVLQANIMQTPLARTGAGILRLNANAGSVQLEFGNLDLTELYVSFAFMWKSTGVSGHNIFQGGTGTVGAEFNSFLGIRWNTGGTISAMQGANVLATSAAVAPNGDTWYVVEAWLKPHNNALTGRFVIKIDGATVIDFTGDTTGGQEAISGIRFNSPNNTNYLWFDDFCLNNDSGSYNNSFPGLARLQPIRMHAAGDVTQLTRTGVDLSSNVAQVRSPMVDSGLEGDVDEYDLYATEVPDLPAGATINGVHLLMSGKSVSGAGTIAGVIKANATENTGSTKTLLTSDTVLCQTWDVDPSDAGVWAEGDLSGLQLGVKVKS